MEKDRLHRYLGKIVNVSLYSGEIIIGKLAYHPSYCSRLGFTMPDSYYIGDYSFKADEVKIISTVQGES